MLRRLNGRIALIGIILALWAGQGFAQSLSALARVTAPLEAVVDREDVVLTLPLSQPVPWRTRLLSGPPRAVIDFRTVDWSGLTLPDPLPAGLLALRTGDGGGGWARMVIDLINPMTVAEAGMSVDTETGGAVLTVRLQPADAESFDAQASALAATEDGALAPLGLPERAPIGLRPTVVVLDPGHGGVDPGAVHGGVNEADLMLTFARELSQALVRSGRYEVVLTRDSDQFVSLEERIAVAHAAQADLFLSLHADAVTDGQAFGATVYTLATEATDAASATLAERHDRDNIVGGGVDLADADDSVAEILMELARTETGPSTDRLARALVGAIQGAGVRMHRFPWQQAAFSVLKSASVPSALLELGFLSSERDRDRIRDPEWRAQMVGALVAGLDTWVLAEAETAALLRR